MLTTSNRSITYKTLGYQAIIYISWFIYIYNPQIKLIFWSKTHIKSLSKTAILEQNYIKPLSKTAIWEQPYMKVSSKTTFFAQKYIKWVRKVVTLQNKSMKSLSKGATFRGSLGREGGGF